MPTVRPPNTRRSRGPNHALTRGEDMDERPGDRLSTTDVDESREATEPRSGWARPVVEEEVAGRPAAPADVAVLPEAEPSTHQLPGNGWTDGIAVAEPPPPLHEPVEPRRTPRAARRSRRPTTNPPSSIGRRPRRPSKSLSNSWQSIPDRSTARGG